jgi:UDP-glucose 4-epimerase
VTRRVLVTGGAGFIGSHVVDACLDRGWDVTVLDDLSSGRREQVPAGVTFHELKIQSPEAAALVRDGDFDAICHLAAQIDVRRSVTDPVYDASVNILGTLNLLEAARTCSKRPRVVFSSTGGAIYGAFVEPPSSETDAKEPEAPYGTSKLSIEYYLAYYGRVHGMETVALRYGNVYGPRQDPHGEAGVVAIFCGRILEGRPVTVFGDGEQTRDYVYVTDVARANLAALESELPAPGRVNDRAFNVGTATETSVLTLARVLSAAHGVEPSIEAAPARAGELQRSAVRIDKSARQLGWRPLVGIEEGLALTLEWFASRQPVTNTQS